MLVQEAEGKAVRYSTDNESAILVTKSDDLVIVLPASEHGPAIYIDVPTKYIDHVTVTTLEDSSQLSPVMDRTVVALSIQMSPIAESSCYINAVQRRTKSIEVAFDNIEAAQSVKRSLAAGADNDIEQQRASQSTYNIDISHPNDYQMDDLAVPDPNLADVEHLREPAPPAGNLLSKEQLFKDPPISQSEKGIDVSQLEVNSVGAGNGSRSFLKEPEDLIARATQANALLSLGTPLEGSNLTQLRATNMQHSEVLDWREAQVSATNGPLTALHRQIASVSPGIPVHLETVAVKERSNQSAEQLEDASEAVLRSSALWRNGTQLIECAAEFEKLPTEQDNQQTTREEQRRKVDNSFPSKSEDHNSLYVASPKAPQGEPQPAENSVEQISKNLNQEKLAKNVPTSNSTSKPGKSLSKKLTKRMRNDDDEGAIETPTKNAKTPQILKKPSSRGKIPDVDNGNTGGQVQTKRRQGKQQIGTSKSTASENNTVEAFDDFDIPDSPPRRKSHRKPVSKASTTEKHTTKTHTQIEKRNALSKFPMPSTLSSSSTRRTQLENTRKTQANPEAKSADAVNWDEDLNVDDTEVEGFSHPGKRKAAESQKASGAKGKSAKKRAVTKKASTAPLNQHRTRRAAALTASKKIQGIAESNGSEKEEAFTVQPSKHNDRTSIVQEEEHLKMSHPPGAHRSPGSVAQKIASIVTPKISLNNQQPDNQVRSASGPQDQTKPLASQADPRTSPSEEVVLVDHSETYHNTVEIKQGTLQLDALGTTNYVSNGKPTAERDVSIPALHENIDIEELGFLAIEDSHFQDAMAFSTSNVLHDSKSAKLEGNGPSSIIDNTSKEILASNLGHVIIHNKSPEKIDKIVKTSVSENREPWASKLAGALVTVPKVLEVTTPQSARVIPKQDRTQHVSHNIFKAGESRLTNKAIQSGLSAGGVSPTFLPRRVGYQKREEEPTPKAIEADGAKLRKHAPYASPAVSPALRPSMTQLSEVIHISSGVEDSSDASHMDDPEVTNQIKIDPVQNAAWAAQTGLDISRAAGSKPQVLAAKVAEEVAAPKSVTRLRSEKRKRREAERVRQSSGNAIANAAPRTNSGDIETHKRTPDPKRKSNLISFSAKGPRNQGIASSPRPKTLKGDEHQDARVIYPKKRHVYKLEHEDEDISEVPAEDPTLINTHKTAPTDDHRAQETAPSRDERRVGKLILKLRKAMPTMTRDEVAVTSPLKEITLPREQDKDDNDLIGEVPGIVPVATAPTLAAQPFVRLADMGYKPGVESRRHEDDLSTRTLSAVPVRLPNAASTRLNREPPLVTSQPVDAVRRETKRQTDESGVDVLNDIALGKRRKMSSKVLVAEKTVSVSVPKPSRSIDRDLSQRTGSQSVRVDKNGSPMPFIQSRDIDVAESQPRLTQDIVRVPITARLNRDEGNDPTLPLNEIEIDETETMFRQASRVPHTKKWPLGSSGNSKLQPSSPNAPSSIVDEMEPHHIHPSGKFINVETEDVITAHEPPDPFVGTAKGRSNTFMEALRRTSNRPQEPFVKGPKVTNANIRKASRMVTYDEDQNGDEEDLEKTLIEPESQGKGSETASETSSTSQRSHSEDRPPSGRSFDNAERSEEKDEWQKALQPHQGNTLDVLYDISHVSSLSPPICNQKPNPDPSTSSAISSPKKLQCTISSTTTNAAANV